MLTSSFLHYPFAGIAQPDVLSGNHIKLRITNRQFKIGGKDYSMFCVNDSVPAPTLRFREGEEVTIDVFNGLMVDTSIHWHGFLIPSNMDGVPHLSFPGIAPGQTFRYKFKLRQHGTYWYHSHSGFQALQGMYGAIVIDPAHAKVNPDNEKVIVLSDATTQDPYRVLATLRRKSDIYAGFRNTLTDTSTRPKNAMMWNMMRMSPYDLSDISSKIFTYLLNADTLENMPSSKIIPGTPYRLRIINAASNTIYDMRIPELDMKIVAVDGVDVEPVTVHEFRIAPAETYDVIITPKDQPYCLFGESIERSGCVAMNLSPSPGTRAPIPQITQPEQLTDVDMMGSESHHGHHGHHGKTPDNIALDMIVDKARESLEDPGVGLRNRKWRVLSYEDLVSVNLPPAPEPIREIEFRLTGNMYRYIWQFNGIDSSHAPPEIIKNNTSYLMTLHNDTMMTHPIHLHGMWSDVCKKDGTYLRKHTITVQGAQKITARISPDIVGRWAFHCHLSLHMQSGMFREVRVIA